MSAATPTSSVARRKRVFILGGGASLGAHQVGVIKRLAEEAAKAAKNPAVAERFKLDDAEAVGSTPDEYAIFIASEQKRWGEVVRKANIKAN